MRRLDCPLASLLPVRCCGHRSLSSTFAVVTSHRYPASLSALEHPGRPRDRFCRARVLLAIIVVTGLCGCWSRPSRRSLLIFVVDGRSSLLSFVVHLCRRPSLTSSIGAVGAVVVVGRWSFICVVVSLIVGRWSLVGGRWSVVDCWWRSFILHLRRRWSFVGCSLFYK